MKSLENSLLWGIFDFKNRFWVENSQNTTLLEKENKQILYFQTQILNSSKHTTKYSLLVLAKYRFIFSNFQQKQRP